MTDIMIDTNTHQKPLSTLPCIDAKLSPHREDSAKMTQREMRKPHPLPTRNKSTSLSSLSAACRIYRNLSGSFLEGNLPDLEDSVVSGRCDKEHLRKSTMVRDTGSTHGQYRFKHR
jgi:hypothetical protein